MRRIPLLVRIVGALIVITALVGVSVGLSLYNAAVTEKERSTLELARTTAALIAAVGEFDRQFSAGDHPDGAFGATMDQVHEALHGLPDNAEATTLRIVARADDGSVQTLVRQHDLDLDDPSGEVLAPDAPRATAMLAGLDGKTGIMRVRTRTGIDLIMAHAPIAGMDAAVTVEADKSRVIAPFLRAAYVGATISAMLILLGAIYTYSVMRDVTRDLRRSNTLLDDALHKARDARAQLADALDASSEGFALFDEEDRLVICNEVYREMYATHREAIRPGRTLEQILRAGLAVGAFPDAVGREEDWLRERLHLHIDPEGPVEQRLSNGRWLLISERRTREGGIVGVRTDITALKTKEEELRESEQRFRDFTDTASDWVWETDAHGRFARFGGAIERNEAVSPNTSLGKTRWEVTTEPTDTPKWIRHREAIQAREPFRDFRYWVRVPSGERLISVSGVPVFGKDGAFLGYRGTGRDITEEDRRIQDLREAEERVRVALESVTVGVVLADEQGRIQGFNPAAQAIFGYSEAEILGQNVEILMPERLHGQHGVFINDYRRTGVAAIIGRGREEEGRRKSGEIFPLHLGLAEMHLSTGRQFITSITDLTQEKLLQAQLRRAQKMDAVGQLVGGIAHDFNNILGIIIGNLDLAKRRLPAEADERAARQIERASGAAQRGAALTRRLLNFSRQAPVETGSIDVNASIQAMHDLIQRSITSNIDVALALSETPLLALADRGDFEDALVNLALNARDAMPKGGRLIIESGIREVTAPGDAALGELAPGRYVEVAVTDTGCGIAREHLPRIFDPFFSTKEAGKGTGLGLSMVYGFARRSKGSVTVYSEVGQGTTFRLYLPVGEAGDAKARDGADDQADSVLPTGSETVLIVDDEEELARIAATILEDLGYRTRIAHTGAEALALLRREPDIALMLSDVIMPGGMDGFDLAREAELVRPGLRICLATGFAGGIGERGREAGVARRAYPVLQKPYSNRDLARRVRALLDEAPARLVSAEPDEA